VGAPAITGGRSFWSVAMADRRRASRRVYPFHVFLDAEATGLRVDSKAQAEQVRSIAVERLGPVMGRLTTPLMNDVDEALRLHLGL